MNKVILLGRLTRDPELKVVQGDCSVCNFCVAINRRYDREKADFINCTAWRGTADAICKYFVKGRMIGIIGSIRNNDYTDSDGARHRVVGVKADEFYFVDSTKDAQDNASDISAGDFSAEYIAADDELPWNN